MVPPEGMILPGLTSPGPSSSNALEIGDATGRAILALQSIAGGLSANFGVIPPDEQLGHTGCRVVLVFDHHGAARIMVGVWNDPARPVDVMLLDGPDEES